MSLVNLAHVCSHLTNASKARLGLTSIPNSNLHLRLSLALQNAGLISTVVRGGPTPPPPHLLLNHPSVNDEVVGVEPVTQSNVASRRLWLGLKYWQSEPVLSKMSMKPSTHSRQLGSQRPPMTTLTKVLITGGTGFVGSAIARALAEKHPECDITLLDRNPPGPVHLVPSSATFIQADVTSADDVMKALRKASPSVVIHTAGLVPPLGERYRRRLQSFVWRINVEGTKNVLAAAKGSGVKAFVYTSSCCAVTDNLNSEYHNIDESWPTSHSSLIYGESKAAAETLVLDATTPELATCVLRPSVLCGPGDYQLIPSIHACIAKGETPYIIGSGLNLWDVTYVTNVADAHVLASENLMSSKTATGEVFFIQNNEPITFRDFCLAIWSHFGHVPPYQVNIPIALLWFAGLLAECLNWVSGTAPTLSRGSVKDASSVRFASGEKARRILGYEARVDIGDAIRLSCEDYAARLGVDLNGNPKGLPGKRLEGGKESDTDSTVFGGADQGPLISWRNPTISILIAFILFCSPILGYYYVWH
ncbi:erg26, C-3 sterol dehydrogenase [Arachnomyces sp. PD_36]|nr:erg26, C-3 sterol dehydrogenase [Arachnomyces sp. PD_36]